MTENRKHHCWECRRRSLVCDSGTPACARCASSGVECPGYMGTKPTQYKWLAPNRVKSRPRRRLEKTASERLGDDTDSRAPFYLKNLILSSQFQTYPGISALYETIIYFNGCIYPDLVPITELGPNSQVYPISLQLWHKAQTQPEYLQYAMMCMILSHYLARMPNGRNSKAITERFYNFRGIAIRALTESLARSHQAFDDMLPVSVLTLLLVEIAHGSLATWRWHLAGLEHLLAMRGGFSRIIGAAGLEPFLTSILSISVFGNTTSPTSELAKTEAHMDAINYVLNCSNASPFQICPPPLFVDIIIINHLRNQTRDSDTVQTFLLSYEAHEVLERNSSFRPVQWALSKRSVTTPDATRLWTIAAQAYQAAVALYCILSLNSILGLLPTYAMLNSSFPNTSGLSWEQQKEHIQKQLSSALEEAMQSLAIKRFMLWPLVVLGVSTASCSNDSVQSRHRGFVVTQLEELSHYVGSSSPLAAKTMLRTFWAKGPQMMEWEGCFDKAYVFTSQIAVDTSGVQ